MSLCFHARVYPLCVLSFVQVIEAASEEIAGGTFFSWIPKVGVGSDVCYVGKARRPAYLPLCG